MLLFFLAHSLTSRITTFTLLANLYNKHNIFDFQNVPQEFLIKLTIKRMFAPHEIER